MADDSPNKWLVFSLVAAGVFMSTLDSSIVNIALPVIMADFQVPLTRIEWVPMIYLLTVSSLLLTCGRLSDIRGRRLVYCGGFVIFAAGSLLCGISGGVSWLIASRTLQGVGAAMLMACSPALVVDAFPLAERGRALGMVGMVVAAGLIFNTTFRNLNGGRDLTIYSPSMQSIFMTAFQDAMLAGAAVAGLGIVVAYLRGQDSGRAEAEGA